MRELTHAEPVVLHVLEALEGGTARHVVDLVRHAEGVHHVVAMPRERVGWVTDHTAADAIERAGGRIELVDMRRSPFHPRNAVAVAKLRRLIAEVHPNVVHGHSSVGGALARLATLGSSIAVVYTPNGITDSRLGVLVERALARRTTHFIAVSPSEATLARHLHLAPSNALSIVPNGVELSTPFEGLGKQLRENLGIPPDAFVVGTLSRPVHQKAPEVFMRAALSVARQDPSAQVIMIGSSPLGRTVFHEAAELGRRFHLVDQLDDAAEYLDAFDVYASASRFEGGPYAPLEAMRAGVPVVLTDVVGNRDIVEHEQTGLLVPPDNPRALADALEELRHDKDLRETLAKAATAALSQFDVRVSGERTGAIYSALTGARR